jgi:malate synthase
MSREVLPDGGASEFWKGLSDIVERFAPRNRELLLERDRLQSKIDEWHRQHGAPAPGATDYESFLKEIGYLVPEGPAFHIETANIDPEVAAVAGPQLVVPVSNARYALNAANARWGSLYDALYGSDALGMGPAPGGDYDPVRGRQGHCLGAGLSGCSDPLEKGITSRCDALRHRGPVSHGFARGRHADRSGKGGPAARLARQPRSARGLAVRE